MRDGRFRIDEVFALEARHLVVMPGEIVEGVVAPGMFLWIPFDDAVNMTARIEGVEAVRYFAGREKVALTFSYEDQIGRELLVGMNVVGETLRVSDEGQD